MGRGTPSARTVVALEANSKNVTNAILKTIFFIFFSLVVGFLLWEKHSR
jgi:hypothetical protein